MMPRESHTTTRAGSTPPAISILVTATPAAPAPLTATRRSPSLRLSSVAALRSAASTTIAVPCWSSWKTGMSSASSSRRSTSKQRGALMSSRLIPPNEGASALTVATISSTSCVSRQTGTASTPANCLNSTALPSITGSAARGPMLPRPSTAEPSVTTATVCDTQV